MPEVLARFVSALICFMFLATCGAQEGSQSAPKSATSSLFNSMVPDASVQVQKHPTGADFVEITIRAPGYPGDLLRSQIQKLGQYLKSEPRGVNIEDYYPDADNREMHFTRGTFAIDGIIDRKLGSYRINPIVQALAGAPKPWTLTGVEVVFQGEVPTSTTIQRWPSQTVPGEGKYEGSKDARLTGVDYRIKLLSQDPSKFDIPEPGQVQTPHPIKTPQESGFDWVTISVFIVAVGAVGALVYSLLLRVQPKTRK